MNETYLPLATRALRIWAQAQRLEAETGQSARVDWLYREAARLRDEALKALNDEEAS